MAKQFLIITSKRSADTSWDEREQSLKIFVDNLESQLSDVTVCYTTYSDITCTVRQANVTMYDTRNSLDLADVALVHFKNWVFDNEQASTIAQYLDHHHVDFYNSEVNTGIAWGKISQMVRLAFGGVAVPDTYFAKNSLMSGLFATKTLPNGFAFPIILKGDNAAKGKSNYLVQNYKQAVDILRDAPDTHFVMQNFVPNDGDYRLLFFGLDTPPLVFHRRAVGDSHLNNTSQGGQGSFIDVKQLPSEFVPLARQAAQLLRREIGGVDILVNKISGEAYVLEVNATPAIATGYGVDRKSNLFARFIQSQLDAREEE